MVREYTEEERRIIELGRAMYLIYQDSFQAYFDKEFFPSFKPTYRLRIPPEALLREADLLAKERGYEKYEPNAYSEALEVARRPMNEAIAEACAKDKEQRESEAKRALWEEILIDELKSRGVYDKKIPLPELERKYLNWQDDRILRQRANSVAHTRHYKFRY